MTILVTGGCGFVGRNVVKHLTGQSSELLVVDNLISGIPIDSWLPQLGYTYSDSQNHWTHTNGGRLLYINDDVRTYFRSTPNQPHHTFEQVFHFAAIVGGRVTIEGDPLSVATDLAIDADFFNWLSRTKPTKTLYPSSSAAYPIALQRAGSSRALMESDINFQTNDVGVPDLTYGWAKLTGEYLATVAAEKYGISIACVRPFSGYGGDQDPSYPIPAIARRAMEMQDPLVVWGSGLQGRDFVHIDDCVRAMLIAINTISNGSAMNISSGRLTSFFEVAKLFADLVGYSPRILPLSDKPEGVQERFGDPSLSALLGWAPQITLEAGFQNVLTTIGNK